MSASRDQMYKYYSNIATDIMLVINHKVSDVSCVESFRITNGAGFADICFTRLVWPSLAIRATT